MKQVIPILLIIGSFALIFFFVIPQYKVVQNEKALIASLNSALTNSRQVQGLRDSLLTKYNTISDVELDRLKKILPDHVDNVRLILEFDRIALRNGMVLQNVSTQEGSKTKGSFGPDESLFGKLRIRFSVIGQYDSLVNFLTEIEQSLRVVDIVALSFTRGKGDLNEYEIEVETYWLK